MDQTYSRNDLEALSKDTLITLLLGMQDELSSLRKELSTMNQNMDVLLERLGSADAHEFGRSTEKLSSLMKEGLFNEAEAVADLCPDEPEPDFDEVMKPDKKHARQVKETGKREKDLSGFEVEVIRHRVSEEKLRDIFGGRWKQLPDYVYRRLRFRPAAYVVEEHHVEVYASMDSSVWKRADRPVDLLRNSIATPSLVAALYNAKFINGIPLYRLCQEFQRSGLNLTTQVMSNWVIRCSEDYLKAFYTELKKRLFGYHVLQADETPVSVSRDGRPAGSKSYMWVYRSGRMYTDTPVILYEYQKTRKAEHPREFLQGFTGVLVTDGYQVYHSIGRDEQEIRVAGCWSHLRRRFADAVKAISDKEAARETVAFRALSKIAAIYKLENTYTGLSAEERRIQRDINIRPLVEDYFAWIRLQKDKVPSKSKTGIGITYSLNQEEYLKVFLEDGEVPLDNNASEQAIRSFVIGKKNWQLIDTVRGAEASAVAYSIAETAKANHLNPYRYFEYLLTELPKHQYDKDKSYMKELLPWSESLPEDCRKKIN